jgi:hypothetical protein
MLAACRKADGWHADGRNHRGSALPGEAEAPDQALLKVTFLSIKKY